MDRPPWPTNSNIIHYNYHYDSTLISVMPSPDVRVTMAESLIRDLGRVSDCMVWPLGDEIECEQDQDYDSFLVTHNASPCMQSSQLTIGGTVLKESDDHVILGVTSDSKMTFEKHLCSVSRAASQRLGILRKSWRVFHDRSLLGRCFLGFVLPVLEYCSAVWCSAADKYLKLLDRVVSGVGF